VLSSHPVKSFVCDINKVVIEKVKVRMPTAVVTGANKGIGFYTAKGLLSKGYTVILAVRDAHLGEKAKSSLLEVVPGSTVSVVTLDVADGSAVDAAAATVKVMAPTGIDVLVNNAGIAFKKDALESRAEQARLTVNTNYYGTLRVTNALRPQLNPGARVVNVGSRLGVLKSVSDSLSSALVAPTLTEGELNAFMDSFVSLASEGKHVEEGWLDSTYGASKLGAAALTIVHARDTEFVAKGITVTIATPGYCKTDMTDYDNPPRTAEEGADTIVWACVDDSLKNVSAKFFGDRKEISFVDGN
jgi:carbonyl reductase 1